MGMLWTVFLFWVWTYVTQSNSSSQEDSGNDANSNGEVPSTCGVSSLEITMERAHKDSEK
ncbi:hypothetical protein JHK85_041382 [Glycine max]|nr:hypothetical protein JHK86_040780 [Glycine max]KAG4966407.1 hypothetical protein JHK85_041382 [Glycine max]